MEIIEEIIHFESEGLSLEGRLAYPEGVAVDATACLLAPHPHFGGNLDNNVIQCLATRLAEAGAATLRFNYRGVGNSELNLPDHTSRYAWFEAMEQSRDYGALVPDVLAAARFLEETLPKASKRWLVGYSFGAVFAGMSAAETTSTHVVAISPPIARVPLDDFRRVPQPKIFLTGDQDFVFDEQKFKRVYDTLPEPKQWVPLAGCDHFYRGVEPRLPKEIVKNLTEAT